MPGITSVYEWEGKIENDSEVLMMIKTRSSRIPELTEFVKSKNKNKFDKNKIKDCLGLGEQRTEVIMVCVSRLNTLYLLNTFMESILLRISQYSQI